MPSKTLSFKHADLKSFSEIRKNGFLVRILTGGSKPPQVTLANNSGFPAVQDHYARAVKDRDLKMVHVDVRFVSDIPGSAKGISFNIFQEDATEFTWVKVASDH